jgi:hypothetical protein
MSATLDALDLLLPQGSPPELTAAIADAARNVLDRHGAVAFEAPREAAIFHEASHAVVGAHEGLAIRRVAIYSRSVLGTVWGGRCLEAGWGWTTDHETSADADLKRARFVIAGLAGEALAGLDKPGSSLDELALSQALGVNAAVKLDDPKLSDADWNIYAQNLWHEQVWAVALAILRANGNVVMQLAEHLNQHGQMRGTKLRRLLANVKRIAS